MKRKISGIIFGVAVLLVGIVLVWAHWKGYFKQLEANRSYQPIEARVVSTDIRPNYGGPRQGPTVYHVQVTYGYQVEGEFYEVRDMRLPHAFVGSIEEAYRLSAMYPKGKIVTAYYNPAQPSESVLDRGEPSLLWPFLMALFPALGLAIVWLSLRS